MCVVSEAVLEPDIELGQVTARHQLTCFEVSQHRLAVLVVHSEAVALGEPGGAKRDVLLVQVVLHNGAGGTVFAVILCIGGEAYHLVMINL